MRGPVTIAVTGPFASGKSTLVRLLGEQPGHGDGLGRRDRAPFAQERPPDHLQSRRTLRGRRQGSRTASTARRLAMRSSVTRRHCGTWKRYCIPSCGVRPTGASRLQMPRCSSWRYRCSSRRGGARTSTTRSPSRYRRSAGGGGPDERGVDDAALRGYRVEAVNGRGEGRRADFVVQNDGDLDRLEEQAEGIGRKILRERGSHGHLR